VMALLCGLLGAVALGAVAGARRTATAYGRYLAASRVSDVFVNVQGIVPGMPVLEPASLISSLPGVAAHVAYIGGYAYPVVHGHLDRSFLTDGINASLDGEWFRQDRMTVLAGRLPRLDSTGDIVLTPLTARMFGTGVGGHVTYAYHRVNAEGLPTGPQFTHTYRAAAIVEVPPALVDESDQGEGGVLPPGATRQVLAAFTYATVGLRLARGPAGIPRLERDLAKLAASVQRQVRRATHQGLPDLAFPVDRPDLIHDQVQQAIRPEATALTIFGMAATLGLLVLVGQGLAQMLSRTAPDIAVIRALGGTRAQAALAAGLPGAVSVLGGVILAVAGAVALSPLAPVGPVRRFDPSRGVQADWLVLGPGAALLAAALLGLLAFLAVRSVRRPQSAAGGRPSVIARKAAAAGLPAPAVEGIRLAVEPGSGRRAVPVRSALLGSIAVVAAVVAAVVFGASLTGLVSHPAWYGWNWDVVIQAEGGYGSFAPGSMARLIRGEPAVAGWSEMAFTQLSVDGRSIPVLGLRRDLGTVQPPTTSGRPRPDRAGPRDPGPARQEGGRLGPDRRRAARADGHDRGHGDPALVRPGYRRARVARPGRDAARGHLAGRRGPDRPAPGQRGHVPPGVPLRGGDRPRPRDHGRAARAAGGPDRVRQPRPDAGRHLRAAPRSRDGRGHRQRTATGPPAAGAGPRPRRGGHAVPGPDRARLGAPAAHRARPAEDARHDPGPGPVGHRLTDHVHAGGRGGDRRPAGRDRRPVGLA
jgi:hypothetical protein